MPGPSPQDDSRRSANSTAASVSRVLIADHPWPDLTIEREILAAIGAEIVEPNGTDEASLIEAACNVDAIGTCWAEITPEVIDAAPRCRIVTRYGIGLDNIAVGHATNRGIPVTNHPTYCVDEVAEHALAQVLGWERKVIFYDRLARTQRYELQAGRTMHRLSTRVLGIVGFGRIGQALADRALALGMQVKIWTPSGNDRGKPVEVVETLDRLLSRSDYVSIHAPLTTQTRHLFSTSEFESMQPSALLINTSRGGLIDQSALLTALNSGQLAGAALDVFDPEPPDMGDPLIQHDRVFITPHAAFVSAESLSQLRRECTEQILAVLDGQNPTHIVNPEFRQNRK